MHDRAFPAGMMALANAFGMTVTGEGVEHRDQATLLCDMACPSAQGWLYSKAVPCDEATPLLDHVCRQPRPAGERLQALAEYG